jgi:hypothetical protein
MRVGGGRLGGRKGASTIVASVLCLPRRPSLRLLSGFRVLPGVSALAYLRRAVPRHSRSTSHRLVRSSIFILGINAWENHPLLKYNRPFHPR